VILAGRDVAARIRDDVRSRAGALRARGIVPHCRVFAAEGDAEGAYYAEALRKVGLKVDVEVSIEIVPLNAGDAGFAKAVTAAGADASVHGILVQRPLPKPFTREVICAAIAPRKDVDAANPCTFGLLAAGAPTYSPATAAAVLELLREHHGDALAGADAVVVGRSPVVGKPVAYLLTGADATVTVCHSRTRDLAAVCSRAGILVVAMGRPKSIRAEHVKRGATVIDVGATVVNSRIVGDVDADSVAPVAGALSPVPGGVGPVTTSILLRSVVESAEAGT
jgi:methylenetetrahydrofolate dehydrogenase (NADP+)/methenyltetrahydrofolate cyclohydrolase